jgi:hypothetical protein
VSLPFKISAEFKGREAFLKDAGMRILRDLRLIKERRKRDFGPGGRDKSLKQAPQGLYVLSPLRS